MQLPIELFPKSVSFSYISRYTKRIGCIGILIQDGSYYRVFHNFNNYLKWNGILKQ